MKLEWITINRNETDKLNVLNTALDKFIKYEIYRASCAKSGDVKDSCADNIETSKDLIKSFGFDVSETAYQAYSDKCNKTA